jgi:hypothetical protein
LKPRNISEFPQANERALADTALQVGRALGPGARGPHYFNAEPPTSLGVLM